jgi:glycosyltransferase involved in cell wall biosynthesis
VRVIYVQTLDRGGPLSHLLTLAPAVRRHDVDVSVICGSDAAAERFRAVGIDACVVPMRHKLDVRGVPRLSRLMKDADVVHTHDRRAGLIARLSARLRGTPVVHTMHGLPATLAPALTESAASSATRASPVVRAWERHGVLRTEAALSRLGPTITPSTAMATFLRDRAGFDRSSLHVIPNAVPVVRSEPRPRDGRPRVGVVARLEYLKGIDVLLRAGARLRHTCDIEIFGDGSWRERLVAEARTAGIRTHFHGHVSDMSPHLDRIDVLVLPSRAENQPMCILEAMAHAIPVVATRVGGVSEQVDDGRTGWLVDAEDEAGLADAIDRLLADPVGAAEMGRRGAARLRERFDPDRMAQRTIDVYVAAASRRAFRPTSGATAS